jgi:hypothetical protein
MPYDIRKQKCKQSDGDSGDWVLSYTDKSGKKHRACHTSKKRAKGQIAAIEMRREGDDNEEDSLIESIIREMLLVESGERGFAYESTISRAFENGGIEVTPATGNNNTISDLGISVDGIPVAIEIKLSHSDNLGAVRKNNFDHFSWDGNSFLGAANPDSKMADIISGIIDEMNDNPNIKSKFLELQKNLVKFKPLPWNLMSIFGSDKGDSNQRAVYSILRNDPLRFPLPPGIRSDDLPNKQIANPKDGIGIDQATLINIMSGKLGPNGAPTSYVIVGYGPGSESKARGQIYSLGSDPLGIGAPVYSPASVGIEIRFGGAGGEKSGRSFSLNFKTKATGKANTGIPFNSPEDLVNVFKRTNAKKDLAKDQNIKNESREMNTKMQASNGSAESLIESIVRELISEELVTIYRGQEGGDGAVYDVEFDENRAIVRGEPADLEDLSNLSVNVKKGSKEVPVNVVDYIKPFASVPTGTIVNQIRKVLANGGSVLAPATDPQSVVEELNANWLDALDWTPGGPRIGRGEAAAVLAFKQDLGHKEPDFVSNGVKLSIKYMGKTGTGTFKSGEKSNVTSNLTGELRTVLERAGAKNVSFPQGSWKAEDLRAALNQIQPAQERSRVIGEIRSILDGIKRALSTADGAQGIIAIDTAYELITPEEAADKLHVVYIRNSGTRVEFGGPKKGRSAATFENVLDSVERGANVTEGVVANPKNLFKKRVAKSEAASKVHVLSENHEKFKSLKGHAVKKQRIQVTEKQLRMMIRESLQHEGLVGSIKGALGFGGPGKVTEKSMSSARQALAREQTNQRNLMKAALRRGKSLDALDAVLKLLQFKVSTAVLRDAEEALRGVDRPWILDSDETIVWFEGGVPSGKAAQEDPKLHYANKLASGELGTIGDAEVSDLARLPGVEEVLSAWMRDRISSPLNIESLLKPSVGMKNLVRDKELARRVSSMVDQG